VSFGSSSDNLVADDTNRFTDVFVRDLVNNETRRISLLSDGSQAYPTFGTGGQTTISASGRYVAFDYGVPLVPGLPDEQERVYLWDRRTEQLQHVSVDNNGDQSLDGAVVSDVAAHGHFVVFWGSGDLAGGPLDTAQVYLRILP
jgi:hypothetical protein